MFKYNFNENANDVINNAFAEARDLGHRFVGTEHLILGLSMIKSSKVHAVFDYYNITTDDLRFELMKMIGKGELGNVIEDYTPRAKACLERSYKYSTETSSDEILPEHIFMSIMQDKYAIGYKVLTKLSLDVQKILLNMIDEPSDDEKPHIIKGGDIRGRGVRLAEFQEAYEEAEEPGILRRMGINLNEIAKDSPFQEIIERDEEINRLIQILTRRTKNNPCIVGEPGVGKTALVQGLVNRIVSGRVPDSLKEKEVISINIGQLVSGTMFRGQFEERFTELIRELRENKKYIAFFDELHTLIGVGATGEKSLDAIGMLKPILTTGEIQLIGTTTYSDYQKYIEKDEALMRRLIPLTLEAPTYEQTLTILNFVKHQYEKHHDVVISDEAIETAIRLSVRYIPDRQLPDKAIDIIDEACSKKRIENLKTIKILDELKYRLQLLKEHKEEAILDMDFTNASRLQNEEKRILSHIEGNENARQLMRAKKLTISEQEIEQAISDWTNIPVTKLQTHEKDRLRNLKSLLEERILGQTDAVEIISSALKRSRLGIKDEKKPVGSYLFVGPTGVGKTELSKAIADVFYGDETALVKIDMSEYMEKHAVSKLIGSPPGYEGNREGGLLTNEVKKNPYCVVVFDEVEKAHPDILNILLSIMDEGSVKDGRGKSVDFKNTLLILTSNLGVEELSKKAVGFGSRDSKSVDSEKLRDAAKKYFKPEFVNRLDEIIVFRELELGHLSQIVQNEMDRFVKTMGDRGIEVTYSEEVPAHIAAYNFDSEYGARPLKRGIDRMIKDQVADILLSVDEVVVKIDIELASEELEFKWEIARRDNG